MTQRILHHRQQFGVVARLGVDQPFGGEAGLVQPRRKQVAAADDPQHRAGTARGDAGHEQHRRRILCPAGPRRGEFVERVDPQALTSQPVVERRDPERQHRTRRLMLLDGGKSLA